MERGVGVTNLQLGAFGVDDVDVDAVVDELVVELFGALLDETNKKPIRRLKRGRHSVDTKKKKIPFELFSSLFSLKKVLNKCRIGESQLSNPISQTMNSSKVSQVFGRLGP